MIYTHKETGTEGTREEWIAAYDPEELAERGLSAAEAFNEGEGRTLFAEGAE